MIRLFNFHAILYAILGVISLLFVVGIGKNIYQAYQLHGQADAAQNEVGQLGKNNEGISQLIQSFQQNSTIELEGRKDLNLQKPGEQAVVIIPPKNYPKDPSARQPAKSSAPDGAKNSTPLQQDDSLPGQIRSRMQLWGKFVFHK